MVFFGEVAFKRASQTYGEENGPDQNVETMETRRHKEGCTVNIAREAKSGMSIFISLETGEDRAKNNGEREPLFQTFPVPMLQRVVRPGNRGTGRQQDQRVDEWQVPRIECFNPLRWPNTPSCSIPSNLFHFAGKKAGIKISPEPGNEEHDF